MTSIKERILKISDFQNVSKEIFFKNLGLSYANFKGIQKKSALGSDAIEKIIASFPHINVEWLITGNGEMLKEKNDSVAEPMPKYESPGLIERQEKFIDQLQSQIHYLSEKLAECEGRKRANAG